MKIKSINNYVLVKPIVNVLVKGSVAIDTTFDPQIHSPHTGIVVSPPANLTYGLDFYGMRIEDAMEWETEVEVQEGDIVYFDQIHSMNGMGHKVSQTTHFEEFNKLIEVDGEYLMFIKYSNCFVAKRDDKFIMLNGYCLVEPTENKKVLVGDNKYQSQRGKIYLKGNKNKRYSIKNEPDDVDISVGDEIIYRSFNNIKLEEDYYRTFGKELFRMQTNEIIGVL